MSGLRQLHAADQPQHQADAGAGGHGDVRLNAAEC